MMQTSDQINELAAALSKAQGALTGAKKDSENPHFRSKYADLASVWEACRAAVTSNGLTVVQSPRGVFIDGTLCVELETRLLHTSGQWMSDTLTVPVGKPDAQGVGSAVTYARRYALAAFIGVAPEDDDGNAASVGTPTYTDVRTGEISTAPTNGRVSDLQVSRVDTKATAKPGITRYTVYFSNGTKATTINDRLGDLARTLSNSGDVIETPVTKQTAYGTDLVELHRKVKAPVTQDDSPNVDPADVPF